jgi:hypothetical protein
MSYLIYPNTLPRANNSEMTKMLRKFFPGEEEKNEDTKKSITVKAKVLPGLKRDNDDIQKFNLRDLILSIIQKGFTTEDSIEAVNDALTRFKMSINKKSPFKDIEYDEYIKQVEDEILAHIVQGDEFKNIGKISDFLYLGDESQIIGDGAHDKDGDLRKYLENINNLRKDDKFILNNHSEDHNDNQAIMSSIYLLKQKIKEYRKKDPSSSPSREVVGVTAENVLLEDLTEKLEDIFYSHLNLFFKKTDRGIMLKDHYLNLSDYISREEDFQNFLFDNFNISSSDNYAYIVVLDEDIEDVETSMYEIMDTIHESMKVHILRFIEMNNFFKNNLNCNSETKISEIKISEAKSIKKESSKIPPIINSDSNNRTTNVDYIKYVLNYSTLKPLTIVLLTYLYQIKERILCILEESNDLKQKLIFNLNNFDLIYKDVTDRISQDGNLKINDYLGIINLLLTEMHKIYNILYKFKNDLENPKLNTDGSERPLTTYQVSKKISKMSELKDSYEELDTNIRIDFKLYNKRYMLNVNSGVKNDLLNEEYNKKLKGYILKKTSLDKKLYKDDKPGHLKDEFRPNTVMVTPPPM